MTNSVEIDTTRQEKHIPPITERRNIPDSIRFFAELIKYVITRPPKEFRNIPTPKEIYSSVSDIEIN